MRRERRRPADARLTAEQAAALALAAIGDAFYAHSPYANPDEHDGAPVRLVASARFDMGAGATVDDATGTLRDIHRSAWPRR